MLIIYFTQNFIYFFEEAWVYHRFVNLILKDYLPAITGSIVFHGMGGWHATIKGVTNLQFF